MSLLPILIVEDEEYARAGMANILIGQGQAEPICCDGLASARKALSQGGVGLVLLDLHLADGNGETLLEEIATRHPGLPVIVVTAVQDVTTAVRCMRARATDYLVKPIDPVGLGVAVRRAQETAAILTENRALARLSQPLTLAHPEAFAGLVTFSPEMHRLMQYAEIIATDSNPVLITGESGTGKTMMAAAIHHISGRSGSCATVSLTGLRDDTLVEALFGSVGDAEKPGLVSQTEDGTLILDEVGDLPERVQSTLLRLIQEPEYRPRGAVQAHICTSRFVATTSVDLGERVSTGRLRADLRYRLQAHHLHLPPLRERLGDLPALVHHFVAVSARTHGRPAPAITDLFLHQCQARPWPGNIRELATVIDRAVASGGGLAMVGEFYQPHPTPLPHAGVILPEQLPTLDQMRDILIAEAVRRAGGSLSDASRLLGMTRWGLSKRLKQAH